MDLNLNILKILTLSFLLNILLFYNLDKISKFLKAYDFPDNYRKIHVKITPLVGGYIFLINFLFLILFDLFLNNKLFLEYYKFLSLREIFIFTLASFSIYLVGLFDDKFSIDPLKRLLLLIFNIYIFLLFSNGSILERINIKILNFSFSFGEEKLVFTLICVISLINILNFYDGINLELIFYCLLTFIYLFLKSHNEYFLFLIVPLILLCIYNFKNKLFLGDGGSYLLGFVISVFLLKTYNTGYVNDAAEIFAILSLPFFDFCRVIIKRIISSKKFYEPDKSHFHHVLIDNFGVSKAVIFMLIINLLVFFVLYFNYYLSILISFFIIFLGELFFKKIAK